MQFVYLFSLFVFHLGFEKTFCLEGVVCSVDLAIECVGIRWEGGGRGRGEGGTRVERGIIGKEIEK